MALAGATLAVFVLIATFVYLTSSSSQQSLNWLYPLSLAFAALAAAEYVFVADQAVSATLVPWLSEFQNLRIVQDLLYLIAGTSLVFFLRAFRKEEE
jgi:hypothetical protein